jgi:hypothetical protein
MEGSKEIGPKTVQMLRCPQTVVGYVRLCKVPYLNYGSQGGTINQSAYRR